MKHVLILNTPEGARFIVNNHGQYAWFNGNPLENNGNPITFRRAATAAEFNRLRNDERYISGATELNLDIPGPWKILFKTVNFLRITRTVAGKTQFADLHIKPGRNVLGSIVKNIDTATIAGKVNTEKISFWYDGKFDNTVVEMLPGFFPIKERKPVAKIPGTTKKEKKAA